MSAVNDLYLYLKGVTHFLYQLFNFAQWFGDVVVKIRASGSILRGLSIAMLMLPIQLQFNKKINEINR